MDFIGILKGRIEKKSKNVKQKDVLSLMYLLFFIISIIIVLNSLLPSFLTIFNIILEYIIESTRFNIIDYNHINELNQSLIKSVNFTYFFVLLKNMLVTMIISLIYVSYFENSKFWNDLIFILISNISISLIFLDKILISIIILTIILIVVIIPIGSGKYFEFIKKIRYLKYIEKDIKFNRKVIYITLIKLLLLFIICVIIANFTSSFISFSLGLIIYLSTAIRIYMGNSKNKTVAVTKKIILYIVILSLYIYLNFKITGEIEKLIALIITMYFSFDRIFSVSKEINELILTKSALYFYEEDNIPSNILAESYLDLKLIYIDIDEISLVIQILLRFNLLNYEKTFKGRDEINDELLTLCDYYLNTSYTSYELIVKYIRMSFTDDLENELEYHNKIEILMQEIETTENQKIFPLDLAINYIYILAYRKDFKKIISVFETHLENYAKNLNDETLKIIIESYNEIGNKEKAKLLKKYLNS